MYGKRREKMFGMGRTRALDRNAKVRIAHWARCLSRRTEKGKAYGVLTAKSLAVLEALLWGFHNSKSGVCFPSYDTIARAAYCARSTVAKAIKALEAAGVLTWVQRVKRIKERCVDLLGAHGWRWRVLRTSNSYVITDPSPVATWLESSKSEKQPGTPNQVFKTLLSEGRATAKLEPDRAPALKRETKMIEPTQNDIGRAVVYRSGYDRAHNLPGEEGVVTSFNLHSVFVRYGSDKHSKGTSREDLEWAHSPVSRETPRS